MLSIRNLSKTFSSAAEPVQVLRGVDLDLRAGERVALTGESGSVTFSEEFQILNLTGTELVENNWSAPTAIGRRTSSSR